MSLSATRCGVVDGAAEVGGASHGRQDGRRPASVVRRRLPRTASVRRRQGPTESETEEAGVWARQRYRELDGGMLRRITAALRTVAKDARGEEAAVEVRAGRPGTVPE